MIFSFPKDDSRHRWTSHIKQKMAYYRISAQLVKSIVKTYDRKEDGIAPNTTAVMRRNDKKPVPKKAQKPTSFRKNTLEEIWVMYQQAEPTNKAGKLRSRKREQSGRGFHSFVRYNKNGKKNCGMEQPKKALHD